jgi:tetratricopeptide (TPR) repeat protein/protein-tyrosine phosphatase
MTQPSPNPGLRGAAPAARFERVEAGAVADPGEVGDLADDRLAEAHVAVHQRHYRLAREMLLAVLRDRPDSVGALGGLATVSTLLGDAGGTLQFADAALRVAPGQPKLLAARATALSALGRRDEARQAAEAAIAYEPRSAEPYAARAGADLAEHSRSGYAAVLDVMARARRAVVDTSPYSLTLDARYACALDGLGDRSRARALLAALIKEHPDSPSVRYQAAQLEAGAWSWRRAIVHLATLLGPADGDTLVATATRRCATVVRLWLVELAGIGALLLVAGVAAQMWSAPAGAAVAVAALAAYVGLVVASLGSLTRGWRAVATIIARSPGAVVGCVLIVAMLAGQIVSVVRVHALTDGASIWLLAGAAALGFGAVTDVVVRMSGTIGHRYKAWANRDLIVAARAMESAAPAAPACILYLVDVPTPGRLSLSGLPAEPSARESVLDAFGACGVDVLVSTLRGDLSTWHHRSVASGVEVVVFPIGEGRAPEGAAFDGLVASIVARLRAGSSVTVVCRTGAERSALVAAAVCVMLGLPPDVAWSHVEQSRQVPLAVSPAQRALLDRFADRVRRDQCPVGSGGPERPPVVTSMVAPAVRDPWPVAAPATG